MSESAQVRIVSVEGYALIEQALRFLDDALDATGDSEDDLIAQPGNEWVYVICARDNLRQVLS